MFKPVIGACEQYCAGIADCLTNFVFSVLWPCLYRAQVSQQQVFAPRFQSPLQAYFVVADTCASEPFCLIGICQDIKHDHISVLPYVVYAIFS